MSSQSYNDDDLVYVDPETRTVIAKVELDEEGNAKSLPYEQKDKEKKSWRKFYPWGTYKSMKNTFRIEGKRVPEEGGGALDAVLLEFLNDSL